MLCCPGAAPAKRKGLQKPATPFHIGDSGRTRTPNLLIRSQLLYPVELRNHKVVPGKVPVFAAFVQPSWPKTKIRAHQNESVCPGAIPVKGKIICIGAWFGPPSSWLPDVKGNAMCLGIGGCGFKVREKQAYLPVGVG